MTTKFHLPSAIVCAGPGGRCYRVDPHTRARMRDAMSLDTEEGVARAPWAAQLKRARQLAALVGPEVLDVTTAPNGAPVCSGLLLGALTPQEEGQLFEAIVSNGVNEPNAATPPKRPISFAARLQGFDADTIALSVHLALTPRQTAERVGFVESVMLLEGIYAARDESNKFQAALHGMALR